MSALEIRRRASPRVRRMHDEPPGFDEGLLIGFGSLAAGANLMALILGAGNPWLMIELVMNPGLSQVLYMPAVVIFFAARGPSGRMRGVLTISALFFLLNGILAGARFL